jgi:hypothetical protein
VAQRVRARARSPSVSSTRGNKRKEIMKWDFNPATHTRRCLVLKTGPAALTQSNFVGLPQRLDVCREKLKPIACCRLGKAGKRLRMVGYIYLP